jgi:hypothetical protein
MSSGSRSIVCPKHPIVNIRLWRSTSCLSHIVCNTIYSERPIPLSFLKLDDACLQESGHQEFTVSSRPRAETRKMA